MNRPGMTLLELVVALVVTGLVLGAGFGALASASDHTARAQQAADSAAATAEVRRQIEAWIAGARLTVEDGGPEFNGVDGYTASGEPDDQLSFLTTAPTPLGGGDVVVALRIDRDTATAETGLVAEFRAWRGQKRRRLQLEPRAGGLDVRYLSALTTSALWMPSWVSSSVLPRGVELRLIPAAGDTLPKLLRLPIVVPLGGGG